jgi:hypothetical protein
MRGRIDKLVRIPGSVKRVYRDERRAAIILSYRSKGHGISPLFERRSLFAKIAP